MTPHDPRDPRDDENENEAAPTRGEQRAESRAYADMADSLARGNPAQLPNPPFEGRLYDAVMDARRFTKNARSRQIRRLAQLLRETGSVEELRDALDGNTAQAARQRVREARCENWRAEMLRDRDDALRRFMDEHPRADRTRLRQLIGSASKQPVTSKTKKAATELLRAIRAEVEVAESAGENDADS